MAREAQSIDIDLNPTVNIHSINDIYAYFLNLEFTLDSLEEHLETAKSYEFSNTLVYMGVAYYTWKRSAEFTSIFDQLQARRSS